MYGRRELYQGCLYDDIKDKAEDLREDSKNDRWGLSLKDCVNKAIDYYWEDILDEEEYEDWDEDDLGKALEVSILSDLNGGGGYSRQNSGYWGLSPRQRNF